MSRTFLEKHADKWEAITETGCFIWTEAEAIAAYDKFTGRIS